MADLSKIILPDNTEYDLKDANALPLSGGTMTGNIVMEIGGEDRGISITDGGVLIGRLQVSSAGNLALAHYDSGGNVTGGVYIGADGTTRIGGDGNHPIYLRPNGYFSATNQVLIGTDGQQIGGHPLNVERSNSGEVTESANAYHNLISVTGLNSSAVYLINAWVTATPTASTGAYIHAGFAESTGAIGIRQTCYTNSTAGKSLNITAIRSGLTAVYLNFYAGVQCKIASGGAHMNIVRLS